MESNLEFRNPGVINSMAVNKSGRSINVYEKSYSPPYYRIIGQIYNNEVFLLEGYQGGPYYVSIKGPNGIFPTHGWVPEDEVDPLSGWHDELTKYPYGYVNLSGTTYSTFRFRRNSRIVNAANEYWGNVASGRLVATDSDTAGEDNPGYMKIKYVQSTNGDWVRVTGAWVEHGFVDIGFDYGSSGATMSMYGSY